MTFAGLLSAAETGTTPPAPASRSRIGFECHDDFPGDEYGNCNRRIAVLFHRMQAHRPGKPPVLHWIQILTRESTGQRVSEFLLLDIGRLESQTLWSSLNRLHWKLHRARNPNAVVSVAFSLSRRSWCWKAWREERDYQLALDCGAYRSSLGRFSLCELGRFSEAFLEGWYVLTEQTAPSEQWTGRVHEQTWPD